MSEFRRKADASGTQNQSVVALLARGIDLHTAKWLVAEGYNLSKLQGLELNQLLALGLPASFADHLANSRPPIPSDVLIKVLQKSKVVCCVCRDPSKSVVIHHIQEWHGSRDHSEDNLAVLCLDHHGEAHTKRELGRNLTPEVLRALKAEWEKKVAESDSQVLLGLSNADGAHWDYFNHDRLFKLAAEFKVALTRNPRYPALRRRKLVGSDGLLAGTGAMDRNSRSGYMYDFGENPYVYEYMKWILEQILSQSPVLDISHHGSRTELLALLEEGKYICCSGAFNFKRLNKQVRGRSQLRRGMREANGIRLFFSFEGWECTSSSSSSDRMSGHRVATVIGLARSIEARATTLEIEISCLAAGSNFHAPRLYDFSDAAREHPDFHSTSIAEPEPERSPSGFSPT